MSKGDEEYLRAKVERLERQVEENRVVNHNIIAMVIGLALFLFLGLSVTGGFLGIAAAIVYLLTAKAFF